MKTKVKYFSRNFVFPFHEQTRTNLFIEGKRAYPFRYINHVVQISLKYHTELLIQKPL